MAARRSRRRTNTSPKTDEDSDYVDKPPTRKKFKAGKASSGREISFDTSDTPLQQTPVTNTRTRHPKSLHQIRDECDVRKALLQWFAGVHDARGMPWRKRYNPNLSPEERAQRAYEVWISEVMLQQTQVVTVIPYYNRWMEKFPTVDKLASSNIEEVNGLWKGLGYYSRASRLLAGAQKVVKTLGGMLPDNAKDLQDKVPGIGRYSAGAICSIAYGERVPVLDGNVHRLLSRFLALHAPPKSKATLDVLWAAATKLVEVKGKGRMTPQGQVTSIHADHRSAGPEVDGDVADDMTRAQYAGDINQALIELGSTVCRVRDPQCEICPLRKWCCAFTLSRDSNEKGNAIIDPPDIEGLCSLCEPVTDECAVTVYPMKIDRKKAREELDIVSVIEWRLSPAPDDRWFFLVRRPENGLLAGLYEFPTTVNVLKSISRAALPKCANDWLPKAFKTAINPFDPRQKKVDSNEYRVIDIVAIGDVVHVFSHVRKTYRVQWVILEGGQGPPEPATEFSTINRDASESTTSVTKGGMWCSLNEVSGANIGSGVIKIWNLVKEKWE